MKTCIHFFVVIAMAAVIVAGLFHGMVSEVELRELKADLKTYNMILADRALAERQADKDLSIVSSKQRAVSSSLFTAHSSQLTQSHSLQLRARTEGAP